MNPLVAKEIERLNIELAETEYKLTLECEKEEKAINSIDKILRKRIMLLDNALKSEGGNWHYYQGGRTELCNFLDQIDQFRKNPQGLPIKYKH